MNDPLSFSPDPTTNYEPKIFTFVNQIVFNNDKITNKICKNCNIHNWSKKLVTFGFIILEMLNKFGVQDFGHNVLKKVSAEQFSASNLPVPKIFIKYRKHCKSYFSFQLSGQIGLIWAVRNYTPS